jgi:S1-C subfamily serine protease
LDVYFSALPVALATDPPDSFAIMKTAPHLHPQLAALAGLAVMLAGCAGPSVSEADWDRRTTRLLQARKAVSQAVVDGDRIAGAPADQYVNHRTALLLGGDGRVTTQVAPNGRSAIVGWKLQPGDEAGGVSSAAAITADGYFLTAAHAVGDARMQVVRSSGRGVEVARVRVVWKGETKNGGPDLALIHAPVDGQACFPMADAAGLPVRSRVWTAGFGDVRQNQSRGRLRSVGAWQQDSQGAPWRLVEHTAPLMRGDSGGPLVDREGRLLGVNTEFLVQPASLLGVDHLRIYRPMAVATDAKWINHIIAKDRARRFR